MATDNNITLQNKVKRSAFGLQSTLKTSLNFGRVQPVQMRYLLPHDTLSDSTSLFLEMKPTTDKLNSTIRFHDRKFVVPIRHIWKDFDKFVSLKDSTFRTANANNTYTDRVDISSALDSTPYFTREKLLLHSLCAFGIHDTVSNGSNVESQLYYSGQSATTYRRQYSPRWLRWNSSSSTYSYDRSTNSTNPLGYLITRWCGENSDLTCRSHNRKNPGSDIVCLDGTLLKTETTDIFKPFFAISWNADDINAVRSAYNWTAETQPSIGSVAVIRSYDSASDTLSFYISWADSSESGYLSNPENFLQTQFSVGGNNFAKLKWCCSIENVTQANGVRQFIDCPYTSSSVARNYSGHYNAFSALCTVLFNDEQHYGKGSLLESMGLPMFVYCRRMDAPLYAFTTGEVSGSPITDGSFNDKYWYALCYPSTYATLAGYTATTVPTFQGQRKFSVLPFLAYQKAFSDYYMLPYEVFKLNQMTTGKRIDNPYYQNFAVPTCIETITTADCDIFLKGYTNSGYWAVNSTGGNLADDHYKSHHYQINNLISIFLNRAPLVDIDMNTRFWRERDCGLGQEGSADSLVVTNGEITSRKKLLAKKIGHILRCGGSNLPFDKYLENQFAVKGVKADTDRCTYLGGDLLNLSITPVFATDTTSLGQQCAISQTQKNGVNSVTFFNQEDSIYLELVHLSADSEYMNFTDETFNKLVKSKAEWESMTMPQYQDTGDEPKGNADINCSCASDDESIAFTNQNAFLKDDFNRVGGDYNDLYSSQIISNTADNGKMMYPVELSYGYLQKNKDWFNLPFSDRLGDKFLLNILHNTYKKSVMTRLNNIGLA